MYHKYELQWWFDLAVSGMLDQFLPLSPLISGKPDTFDTIRRRLL